MDKVHDGGLFVVFAVTGQSGDADVQAEPEGRRRADAFPKKRKFSENRSNERPCAAVYINVNTKRKENP